MSRVRVFGPMFVAVLMALPAVASIDGELKVAQLRTEQRQERHEQRLEQRQERHEQRVEQQLNRRRPQTRQLDPLLYQKRLKKHRQQIERHKLRPSYGTVINRLPPGHRRVHSHRHHDHYYYNGIFYRYYDGHYLVVRPPYGVIVASLPLGYVTLQFGTEVYARYHDVYYRPVPQGYMVVERPVAAPPPPQPNLAAMPANALGSVTVDVDVLNVRSGPSRLHPVTEHVYRSDELYVLGTAPDWYYVRLPQGGFGWVWAEFALGLVQP